ncbi:MAG: DNRLRE domain-containing protein [Nanoarchaeota archaeon]|mgnify:CR=1 FL=1
MTIRLQYQGVNDFINSIHYNAFGTTANKTYINNLVTKIDYDELNRLTLLQTGSLQNLTYVYDNVGNIQLINDTKNSKATAMEYDDLNRLTTTRMFNYITKEHEKFVYLYDAIGNLLSMTNDTAQVNFTFGLRAHAPINISRFDRQPARIELNTTYPTVDISINQNSFFNYTTQICCKNNDCWGVDVYLDPQDEGFTPFSETQCNGAICNKILYSGTRFVFEDEQWKTIENAQSLKTVWGIKIEEDPDFPVQIIDYNYTAITLNLSNKQFRLSAISLKIYNRYNHEEKPKDSEGNIKDKDRSIRVGRNDWEVVTIDLSDTVENLLSQEIKWGDASTIITVYDNNSVNLADSYVRDSVSFENSNFGNETWINIRNSTTSNKHSLIKFDLSHLPREALIENARLFLYLDGNDLDVGESYNVSSYYTFPHYNWTENSVTWNNRPNSTDYNTTFMDKVTIFDLTVAGYLSWNVTSIIKSKSNNETIYLYAHENDGGDSTDEIKFSSRQSPAINKRPYLNITYLLKGVVSTNASETPFYTNVSNPYYVDLEQNQCQTITWWVNATGDRREYIFFAFANKTANQSIGNESSYVNITII